MPILGGGAAYQDPQFRTTVSTRVPAQGDLAKALKSAHLCCPPFEHTHPKGPSTKSGRNQALKYLGNPGSELWGPL